MPSRLLLVSLVTLGLVAQTPRIFADDANASGGSVAAVEVPKPVEPTKPIEPKPTDEGKDSPVEPTPPIKPRPTKPADDKPKDPTDPSPAPANPNPAKPLPGKTPTTRPTVIEAGKFPSARESIEKLLSLKKRDTELLKVAYVDLN